MPENHRIWEIFLLDKVLWLLFDYDQTMMKCLIMTGEKCQFVALLTNLGSSSIVAFQFGLLLEESC